jgi:hypothetical protein
MAETVAVKDQGVVQYIDGLRSQNWSTSLGVSRHGDHEKGGNFLYRGDEPSCGLVGIDI